MTCEVAAAAGRAPPANETDSVGPPSRSTSPRKATIVAPTVTRGAANTVSPAWALVRAPCMVIAGRVFGAGWPAAVIGSTRVASTVSASVRGPAELLLIRPSIGGNRIRANAARSMYHGGSPALLCPTGQREWGRRALVGG